MLTSSCVVVAILLLTPQDTTIYAGRVNTRLSPLDPDLVVRRLTNEAPTVAKFAPASRVLGNYPACLYLANHKVTKYAET